MAYKGSGTLENIKSHIVKIIAVSISLKTHTLIGVSLKINTQLLYIRLLANFLLNFSAIPLTLPELQLVQLLKKFKN